MTEGKRETSEVPSLSTGPTSATSAPAFYYAEATSPDLPWMSQVNKCCIVYWRISWFDEFGGKYHVNGFSCAFLSFCCGITKYVLINPKFRSILDCKK